MSESESRSARDRILITRVAKVPGQQHLEKLDDRWQALLESGKEQGYLTYSQVNDRLPDDHANAEKIDQLLLLLEDEGIELIDESDVEVCPGCKKSKRLTEFYSVYYFPRPR